MFYIYSEIFLWENVYHTKNKKIFQYLSKPLLMAILITCSCQLCPLNSSKKISILPPLKILFLMVTLEHCGFVTEKTNEAKTRKWSIIVECNMQQRK